MSPHKLLRPQAFALSRPGRPLRIPQFPQPLTRFVTFCRGFAFQIVAVGAEVVPKKARAALCPKHRVGKSFARECDYAGKASVTRCF
jgi:hypothetical protein